jgi:UDP-N-acetylglucosamine 2-epimerase (non-hydrolysing)
MLRIAVILGTRPEAIKLAPVILALREAKDISCRVCVTAQHRQMLDQALSVFGITPDTDLDLMRPSQTLSQITARAITALDTYLETEKPQLVLVQGDTTTVFSAALTAFYHHIPVGHVEAGLRTGNLQAPWPEEANRVLASRLAALHFAPTETSRGNLLREGIPDERVFVTGNTVIDALLIARDKIRAQPPVIPGWNVCPGPGEAAPLILITGHRRENFGTGFESLCQAIAHLARRFPAAQFVYPVHLNPQVREPVYRLLGPEAGLPNVRLLEPLDYLPFLALMDQATLILTDSGGVQEEAPSLGKPVLVMRTTTERPEAVEAGTVKLVGTDQKTIIAAVSHLLEDPQAREVMRRAHNPYGDGRAAGRIVRICREFLQGAPCQP